MLRKPDSSYNFLYKAMQICDLCGTTQQLETLINPFFCQESDYKNFYGNGPVGADIRHTGYVVPMKLFFSRHVFMKCAICHPKMFCLLFIPHFWKGVDIVHTNVKCFRDYSRMNCSGIRWSTFSPVGHEVSLHIKKIS